MPIQNPNSNSSLMPLGFLQQSPSSRIRVNSLIITTTLQRELAESDPDPESELQFLPHAAKVPPAIPELTRPSALPNPRSGEHDGDDE